MFHKTEFNKTEFNNRTQYKYVALSNAELLIGINYTVHGKVVGKILDFYKLSSQYDAPHKDTRAARMNGGDIDKYIAEIEKLKKELGDTVQEAIESELLNRKEVDHSIKKEVKESLEIFKLNQLQPYDDLSSFCQNIKETLQSEIKAIRTDPESYAQPTQASILRNRATNKGGQSGDENEVNVQKQSSTIIRKSWDESNTPSFAKSTKASMARQVGRKPLSTITPIESQQAESSCVSPD